MNKEMIEEMASDMDFACIELSKEQRLEIARTLINLDYCKIPDGSVVLQQKDLTKLQNAITQSCNSRLDVDAVNYLTDIVEILEKQIGELTVKVKALKFSNMFIEADIAQLREEKQQDVKETAKEILKLVKEKSWCYQEDESGEVWTYSITVTQLKEFAEKYGVKE